MAKPSPRPSRNQLRIIGGKWRGRKLQFPEVAGLRPTGDRIRETLFNWLRPHLPGARCLDLFAGAGALGLEALSQGADYSLLVDNQPQVIEQLQRNRSLLAIDSQQLGILAADALQWLRQKPAEPPFEMVFVDPPFTANLLEPTLAALEASGLLADPAWIYVEADRHGAVPAPASWSLHKQKHAGDVAYHLYHRPAGEG